MRTDGPGGQGLQGGMRACTSRQRAVSTPRPPVPPVMAWAMRRATFAATPMAAARASRGTRLHIQEGATASGSGSVSTSANAVDTAASTLCTGVAASTRTARPKRTQRHSGGPRALLRQRRHHRPWLCATHPHRRRPDPHIRAASAPSPAPKHKCCSTRPAVAVHVPRERPAPSCLLVPC